MKKVAKLVCVSLMTRVVVEDGLSEDELLEKAMELARPQLIDKLRNDGLADHLESIEDDVECPFGSFNDDVVEYEGKKFVINTNDYSDFKPGELGFNTLSGCVVRVDADELKYADNHFFKIKPLK
jgi:hypothetical protein